MMDCDDGCPTHPGAVSVVASWSFTRTISDNTMSANLSLFVPACDRVTDTAIVTGDTLLVTGRWSATRGS